MQGDHLDGRGIAVQPADAIRGQVGGASSPPAAEPFDQRGSAEPLLDGDRLQPLPDVPQVRQPPPAVLLGEQPAPADPDR